MNSSAVKADTRANSSSMGGAINSCEVHKTDICVIGGGSGGLSVAAGAIQMGARVILIERGEMGGECLNTGCIPSKAMVAAANVAATIRTADAFGINRVTPQIDWRALHQHIHGVIATIAPNDSAERFEKLGVQVIKAAARFIDRHTLLAGSHRVEAKYFVIATGSSPSIPPITGLDKLPYLTNENIFANRKPIEHLLVIGGGPIGMEMAQAHHRLGAKVTLFEAKRLLVRDDQECAKIVINHLRDEGVALHEGVSDIRVERGNGDTITVRYQGEQGELSVTGSHLLIATGRRANVHGLNLEAAGVEFSPRGVTVDSRLRSSNRRIFAIGDVVGPYQFTHMAAYQAGVVIRNMLFKLPARVDYYATPWVTYTDPELAHVGMSEESAERAQKRFRVLRWQMSENDRARAERRSEGMIKVIVSTRGRVLGATIVALHAGELLQPWVLAVSQKMKIGAMATVIAPYPTLSEANRRVAGSFYSDKLFSTTTRRIVRWLMRFS
ncbi:MAG: FAD-dependent oxidoreductase [Mariprofundales bacterium]|nr:FAD-dependent oxidoreductase [Mariprofundales bacterium]